MMTPRYKNERRSYIAQKPRGITVTIFSAYQRCHRNIGSEKFDCYFDNLEGYEVVRQTRPQYNSRSTCLNNHREVKIAREDGTEEKIDIGSSIEVEGVTFNIIYDGMEKFCRQCQKKHGKDCPEKLRFEKFKTLRKEQRQIRKIYSDSSLRNANQIALTTDVACMSGGGIGQIANAIPLDEKRNEVIIYAGNNEITGNDSLNEFAYTVAKAEEKLKKLADENKVTLVLPSVPPMGACEAGKAEYLEEKMCSINGIKTIKLTEVEYDDRNHPTIKGTVQILQKINQELNNEIILEGANETDLTRRSYRQVQPIYKVGCRGCNTKEFTPTLCTECKKAAESFDIQSLEGKIERIFSEQFPKDGGIGRISDDGDVNMREVAKRARDPSDEEMQFKNPKHDSS